MKKIVLFIVSVVYALVLQAADYPYLVFTNTAGSTTVINVSNLTLNVNGSSLEVNNIDGSTSFTLTDLANMQFSKDGSTVTAIDNVLVADKAVEVYSLLGMRLGTFNSLSEGVNTLSPDVYVIKQNTNTQTIVIR